jgi:hypothetical protein
VDAVSLKNERKGGKTSGWGDLHFNVFFSVDNGRWGSVSGEYLVIFFLFPYFTFFISDARSLFVRAKESVFGFRGDIIQRVSESKVSTVWFLKFAFGQGKALYGLGREAG